MEETRNIPVIAVFATATPNSIETAIQNGFECYITKPLKAMRLRESVIKSSGL